jgi:hypothetical protein
MNQLAFTTVVVLVVPQASCVIEVTDEDADDVAAISARWSLRNMIDGAVTGCPRGFDTVQMISEPIDGSGVPLADPAIDLFDCEARAAISSGLTPDRYRVWLEVRSHDLAELHAQSLAQVRDVRRVNQEIATDILNDGGYFQLSWDLVGELTNRPLSCSQVVGLDMLAIVSTSITDAQRSYDDRLRCEDHAAVTGGLLQGSYTITIDAVMADTTIDPATTLTNQVISGQNRVTDLGHILIPIDGL